MREVQWSVIVKIAILLCVLADELFVSYGQINYAYFQVYGPP